MAVLGGVMAVGESEEEAGCFGVGKVWIGCDEDANE